MIAYGILEFSLSANVFSHLLEGDISAADDYSDWYSHL